VDGTGLILSSLGGITIAVISAIVIDGIRTRVRIGILDDRVTDLRTGHDGNTNAIAALDAKMIAHMLDTRAHGRRR
jgi:hypothetical protein